jgi:hypothetical protein
LNYLKIAMIAAVVFTLLGCQGKLSAEPTGQGYIFEVSDSGVLVLDNIKDTDLGKNWRDISSSYSGNAIWLNTSTSKHSVGQKVRYWVNGGINESFPAQASAKKIEIINE